MTRHYKFFQNQKCEYFPCHQLENKTKFNCLFCYCPLYSLGENCGGDFIYNENGIKSCINCSIPHIKKIGYDFIQNKIKKVIELSKKN